MVQTKKPNSLQAVLDRQSDETPEPKQSDPVQPDTGHAKPDAARPSREGKRLIAGHFDPMVAKQLKMLAVEEDKSIQALLEEALDLLFVKKGKGQIGRDV